MKKEIDTSVWNVNNQSMRALEPAIQVKSIEVVESIKSEISDLLTVFRNHEKVINVLALIIS